jgi:hypothetical protein
MLDRRQNLHRNSIEDPLAKKPTTSKKPSAAKKSRKPSKKASPPQHDHDGDDELEEIELDETERKAVDAVIQSAAMRNALELEVNRVVTQAVRKVCKAHGTTLTADQAQNVAMMLFGD